MLVVGGRRGVRALVYGVVVVGLPGGGGRRGGVEGGILLC